MRLPPPTPTTRRIYRRVVSMDTKQLAQQYIAGRWRPGAAEQLLVDRNPFNGQTLAEIREASPEDVDEAYNSAAAAQPAWRRANPDDKRKVFDRAAQILADRAGEFGELITTETGGTALKAAAEIGAVIETLREVATLPLRMEGRIYPSTVPDTENFVYREPVGVVGVISPFNFPFHLSMKSVAPALATGNGVVVKPHEETPLTGGALIAALFEEAGLPAGLLNITVTEIPVIGDLFLEHPVPRVIAFTGSTPTGRHIGEVAARHMKKSVLELGGNSALIVCEDADLDYAVDSAVYSRFTHQGQICMSANRILVHSRILPDFRDRFRRKVEALTTGDPAAAETIIGPLINAREVAKLDKKVEDAIAAGARALVRGERVGNVLGPVVLEIVDRTAAIARDELFGPVVVLIEFNSDVEAIDIANDTDFGLSGAVHTRDIARGVRIAKQIKTGMVHVNDATIGDEPHVPYGGEKLSGLGRLNGQSNIDEFTTLKWISVNHGRRNYPYQEAPART
jgi:acyl-CoA reductase-like NAD-dependent aldehyde dehydrogenase